jgi:predicted DNA-binding protein YlxM (UPF0122 family)
MASSDDTSETSSDELQHAVLEAVQMLPDPQRIVTTLFYIEAYSHQEIASFLEVPKHTIDNRLRAARKHLKERMMDMVKETLHDNAPLRMTRLSISSGCAMHPLREMQTVSVRSLMQPHR